MKIIISPSKQMKIQDDIAIQGTTPLFLNKATELKNHLKELDYVTLKKYLKCSDSIAKITYEQYQMMDFTKNTTPAIFAYSGIQYQYMASQVLNDDELDYLQKHLYILSGLYGLLRPLDEIVIYRLEMQTKCPFSLYDFWQDTIANQIQEPILNLASEEYAKVIRKYKPVIDVKFLNANSVHAKMARGAMVHFLAENQIENVEDITSFQEQSFIFDNQRSTPSQYVFKNKCD